MRTADGLNQMSHLQNAEWKDEPHHGGGEVPGVYTLVGGAIVLSAITAQALSGIRKRPPVGVV